MPEIAFRFPTRLFKRIGASLGHMTEYFPGRHRALVFTVYSKNRKPRLLDFSPIAEPATHPLKEDKPATNKQQQQNVAMGELL